ncbi:unnamed protein product [Callosobruchus maculatus]|uniref:Uncharacterized protein n=1 Tax=Callosobruchus maculatus TaxID=64391 RepID=A0A653CLP5_CALMS|nr:unnamed protein product [Callosobruchus maculatus]
MIAFNSPQHSDEETKSCEHVFQQVGIFRKFINFFIITKFDVATKRWIILTTRHYHQKLKENSSKITLQVQRATKSYAKQVINKSLFAPQAKHNSRSVKTT